MVSSAGTVSGDAERGGPRPLPGPAARASAGARGGDGAEIWTRRWGKNIRSRSTASWAFLTGAARPTRAQGMRCSVVHAPAGADSRAAGWARSCRRWRRLGLDDPRACTATAARRGDSCISCPIRRRWACSEEDVVRSLDAGGGADRRPRARDARKRRRRKT